MNSRVARCHVFMSKIQTWQNFVGPWDKKVAIFYGHLEYIMAI
jgi:hypothetical protein